MTFDELYRSLLKLAVKGEPMPESFPQADPVHLDRLLRPRKYAPVWEVTDCTSCEQGEPDCCAACLFHAIERRTDGKVVIDPKRCSGCASCLNACQSGSLEASRDILPALSDIKHAKGPVYALIAPSFTGQFSEDVTPGRLRSAFLALGFTEMVEVALFADILTLKEALKFDSHALERGSFQLASCCCPVWISMLRKMYRPLITHVPGLVSPMIAAGRTIKALHPDALTVFIGPCLAKKNEAHEPDIEGAVDWVLTYREIEDVFEAADIHPETLEDAESGHASRAGRIYGRAGGVGDAVYSTLLRLRPDTQVSVRHADGTADCKAMLEQLQSSGADADYYEGMGCVGGCVGGPQRILGREEGRENVDNYGSEAQFYTPLENPYVDSLLKKLGFGTVEEFLNKSDIYARNF